MKKFLSVIALLSLMVAIAADAQIKTQTVTVNVNWTDLSDNEANFVIERCQGKGCTNFATIGKAAANATSYVDSITNDPGGVTYLYRVVSENAAGRAAPFPLAGAPIVTSVILLVPNSAGGVIATVVGVQINP
jgi:hypothetical protein